MKSLRLEKSDDLALGLLLLVALAVRLYFFCGLALRDDPAYSSLVHEILTKGYPSVHHEASRAYLSNLGLHSVFVGRPVFLLLIAASAKIFGWSEFSLVLPTLLCSLGTIVVTYQIGRICFSWRNHGAASGEREAPFRSSQVPVSGHCRGRRTHLRHVSYIENKDL